MPFIKTIDLHKAEVLDISNRGDGRHRILKVPYGESYIILKCYGVKRSRLRTFLRDLGALVEKKSLSTVKARHDNELEVLALWKQEGFDVPDVYPGLELLENIPYFIAMEYIPGSTLAAVLHKNNPTPLAVKKKIITRYAQIWGERHARALILSEPRLLQERASLLHVLVSDNRLVHFDFEIVFTRKKDIKRLIRHEIVGVLRSLAQVSGDDFLPLLDTLLENYPNPSHFRRVARELSYYRTVPMPGWTAALHWLARNRKRYRKRINFIDVLSSAIAQQHR